MLQFLAETSLTALAGLAIIKSNPEMQTQEKSSVIYTVGHSNHPLDRFLQILQTHRIELLADIRSQPHSQYSPHFNGSALEAAVSEAGIRYLFLGKELGGQPQDQEFYDREGHVSYSRLAQSRAFLKGLSELERLIATARTALLCGEENPAECHRRLLVVRVLGERGWQVVHLRGDGSRQTEEELSQAEANARPKEVQLSLFDASEEPGWKSTRSVLEKRAPRHSSGR